ncbi:hypothetical protein B0I37DRAFT_202135 [Chaetomium sp. MPI-CAGE-AT-0009]|nr:hypothetical protein B0I37DRAFT_202135 [Chaetomium sp. MPI-CAGE-AT-0009]
MSSASYYASLHIGYAVLSAIYIIPLTVLWFITFCLARKHHDPARVGIHWLKAVFPIWTLGLLFLLVRIGVLLYLDYGEDGYYIDGIQLRQTITHLAITGHFFLYLASILLFITFVELAGGYMLCLKNPTETSRSRKFGRIGILAWSAVLFVLVISLFGLRHSVTARYNSYDDYEASLTFLNVYITNIRLEGAVKILLWLTSIPMVVLGSFTVHKAKNHPLHRSGSVLFLVATILDFIRHTITMAIYAHGYLGNPLQALLDGSTLEPAVDWIVDTFFNFTPMFVLLVILFALAIRTNKGLWSQPQPGWGYPTVTYGPPMPYPPGQVPVGVVPVQPQYMQQQPAQGIPAYLQVAQQQQGQQGYYYYPQPIQQQPQQMQQQQQQPQQMQQQQQQQSEQPQPVSQQQTQEQPKTAENV